ncbi:RNA polymerase factor sigma-70, partial [mine drainage metagenome]
MSVRRLAPIENGTDLDDPLLNLPAPARLQPEAEFERARDYERLAQAMQALPRRQREAFSLRMLEGLDVRTTSRVMACSEGSVKTHLARALNRPAQVTPGGIMTRFDEDWINRMRE